MSKVKKYSSKKVRHKKQNKLFFLAAFVLVIALVILLVNFFGVFDKKGNPVFFEIEDECGTILGNLIHNIQNEGGCKIKCVNNCEIRGMEFYNFSFSYGNFTCHICDCYCR